MSPALILPALFLLALVAIIALVWLASREQDIRTPRNSYYGRERSQERYRQSWRIDRDTRHSIIGVTLLLAIVLVPSLLPPSTAIVIVSTITLAVVAWEISENSKNAQGAKPVSPRLPPARPSQPAASPGTYSTVYKHPQSPSHEQPVNEPPSHETMRTLYAMVNGDRQLAGRLIQSVRERNPGRSDAWCYEKVVHDLERDRQRG